MAGGPGSPPPLFPGGKSRARSPPPTRISTPPLQSWPIHTCNECPASFQKCALLVAHLMQHEVNDGGDLAAAQLDIGRAAALKIAQEGPLERIFLVEAALQASASTDEQVELLCAAARTLNVHPASSLNVRHTPSHGTAKSWALEKNNFAFSLIVPGQIAREAQRSRA